MVAKQPASRQALRSSLIMLTTPAGWLACIASNLVKLHLLSLHIIPLIMTCLPVCDTYYICLLTMFVHQTNALLYPSSITYDETVTWVGYCETPYSFKEWSVILPTWFSSKSKHLWWWSRGDVLIMYTYVLETGTRVIFTGIMCKLSRCNLP